MLMFFLPLSTVMKIVVSAFILMPLNLAMIMGVFVTFKAYYGESSPGGWADVLAGMIPIINLLKCDEFSYVLCGLNFWVQTLYSVGFVSH